ncbi:MAG TPA: aminotransferase class I/II-fold pyridoxal phosphate-dependent enzyme, partial [Polyangiaceae bacterium]|nr:aminotransferase class I/II-fold pyridoxal phosphate-dependent enzyme [Polyangiaceae bacterium]
WPIAPPQITKALSKVQGQSTTNPTAAAQIAATAALTGPRDEIHRMRDVFAKRRRIMVDGLNAIPGVRCGMPRGAFYAFPDVTGLYGIRWGDKVLQTDDDVALWQLDVCGIAAVAGTPFGGPGHIRYTYACGEDVIQEALGALSSAVADAQR